jgi:hypothetical protein
MFDALPIRGLTPALLAVAAICVACSSSGGGEMAAAGSGTTAGGAGATSSAGAAAGISGANTSAGAGGSLGGSGAGADAGGAPSAGSGGTTAGSGGAAGSTAALLELTPSELIFGSVQKVLAPAQVVTLHNSGSASASIASVELDAQAAGTTSFHLVDAPALPLDLAGGQKLDLHVSFEPVGVAVYESRLLITQQGSAAVAVGLYGLGTKGLEGENEPFLAAVLQTLGYKIDVGSSGLLGTGAAPVGSEVAAQLFKVAGPGDVNLVPVARYSPQEPIPYGYYVGATETTIGTISNDQYQTLNPKVDAGSKTSFTPPAGSFGIFTTSAKHKTYSEDAKNAQNPTKHAVRTFPLRDRAGTLIQNAYLICFEEAANGDYQDYVFTITNVLPAAG